MTLKKYIEDLSATTATNAVQADLVKLLGAMKSQNSSQSATVLSVDSSDPSKVSVTIGGVKQTITYIGNLSKTPGDTIIMNGGYGIA